jgi:hypothetical protein
LNNYFVITFMIIFFFKLTLYFLSLYCFCFCVNTYISLNILGVPQADSINGCSNNTHLVYTHTCGFLQCVSTWYRLVVMFRQNYFKGHLSYLFVIIIKSFVFFCPVQILYVLKPLQVSPFFIFFNKK